MKIAYVIEDFYVGGGVERIVAEKASLLHSEYGHDVTVISVYHDRRNKSYPLAEGIRLMLLGVPMAARSGNAVRRTVSRTATLITAARRLNRAVREIQPDIIFFATTLGALLLPLCKTKAIKVFESHSARPFTPYNRLFLPMERCADMVVCLTEEDAMEYRHTKNIKVIPNFISKPSSFVNDYSVKKAVAVGRLEHEKGFDILISCWRHVAEKHPDWQLDIWGEGSCRDDLQRRIDSLGLGYTVTLCGRCDNMMEKYTEYSLQAVSSRYEGLSITLVEGQACGLPAVTFNYKYGANRIIDNGVNGILVEQGDEQAFTDALMKMTGQEELRMKYGQEAKKTFLRFSKDKIMKQWENILKVKR